MTTIPYKPGASGPFVMVFEDLAGAAVEYQAVELRISAGSQCIPITGTRIEVTQNGAAVPAYRFDLPDLPPRLYKASPYFNAGDGMRQATDAEMKPQDIHILYEGGC